MGSLRTFLSSSLSDCTVGQGNTEKSWKAFSWGTFTAYNLNHLHHLRCFFLSFVTAYATCRQFCMISLQLMIQLEISEFYPSVVLVEMWFGSRFSNLCCVYLRCSAVSVSDSHQGLRSTDAGQTTAKSWWITTLWFTAQYHSHHTHKMHDSSHTPIFSAVN